MPAESADSRWPEFPNSVLSDEMTALMLMIETQSPYLPRPIKRTMPLAKYSPLLRALPKLCRRHSRLSVPQLPLAHRARARDLQLQSCLPQDSTRSPRLQLQIPCTRIFVV